MHSLVSLELTDAKSLIAAAETEANRLSSPSNIAIVDVTGYLIAHVRMDGAQLGSVHHSIDKAFTSCVLRSDTGVLTDQAQPGGSLYGLAGSIDGRVITFAGGVPVKSDGCVIGAIGVSGGTAEQDHQIALAAVGAFEKNALPKSMHSQKN